MDALFAAPVGALLIFFLRMTDVSMATFRMLIAVRGHRIIAALIGFFEVLVWILAVGHALQHLDSWLHVVGYAGGFAMGNYVGITIADRFMPRLRVVRAVFRAKTNAAGEMAWQRAADQLRRNGYAVTEVTGRGRESTVEILNIVAPGKEVKEIIQVLRTYDQEAFISVEETQSMVGGYIRPGGRKWPFPTLK